MLLPSRPPFRSLFERLSRSGSECKHPFVKQAFDFLLDNEQTFVVIFNNRTYVRRPGARARGRLGTVAGPREARGGIVGALAQSDQMAGGRLAETTPPSKRDPQRRPRTAGRTQVGWNVLAEELVPFPAAQAGRELPTEHRLPREPRRQPDEERHKAGRPLCDHNPSLSDRAVSEPRRCSRPLTARAGDRRAEVRSRRVASRSRGLQRLLPGAATLAIVAAVWVGAGALSSLHHQALVIPAAAVRVHGGYVYVVRPGDTLWSIASEMEPSGDPRPLVAKLQQQLHGAELVAGDELRLP